MSKHALHLNSGVANCVDLFGFLRKRYVVYVEFIIVINHPETVTVLVFFFLILFSGKHVRNT